MATSQSAALLLWGLLARVAPAAQASVQIVSLTPSVKSPQPLGTAVTWTATAKNSNSSQLTFQFNVGNGRDEPHPSERL